MPEASIVVATVSLLVSGVTLFLTQFRPPRLGCFMGSTVGLNHQVDGFSIYIPLTITNTSHRPGIINRCSILFSRADTSPTSHYIEWTQFKRRDNETKRYLRESLAGPLYIEGRSSVSKLVWFRWRQGEIEFLPGRYVLKIILWFGNKEGPSIRQSHEFFLGDPAAESLKDYKANGKRTIEWISIDSQIEPNKLLTAHEVEKLLGKL
jgi:hypothetical protein